MVKLAEMFPDEQAAVLWLEAVIWPDGRLCPRCKGTDTYAGTQANAVPMPSVQAVLLGAHRYRIGQ